MSCDCINKSTGQPCPEEATSSCHSCRKRICELHTDRDDRGCAYCPDCALEAGVARCREKVGFVTIRDCKKQAEAVCSNCRCPLCKEHAAATPKGVLCSACMASAGVGVNGGTGAAATGLFGGRYRRYYYDDYEPYYWGNDYRYRRSYHSRHYDDGDAYIFEEHRRESQRVEADDGDFDAS